ncbi:MAG: transposase [Candidatus Accumulibacter sp.]|jgi:putative transposase|nr:transposase [Accumulibacter sp.]
MIRVHKIALDLNDEQATYMARAAGCARFAYNWALAEWNRQYMVWKKEGNNLPRPKSKALRRQLNSIKRERFPWMLKVTKCAPQLAIMQLGEALKNFLVQRGPYPTFRRKGVHDHFSISNDQFSVEASRIRIPCLGWVRMRESLRFAGKILSATISRVADRWFASLTVETENAARLPRAKNHGAAGVEIGIDRRVTLHTGERIEGAKSLERLLRRLRVLSRRLARKAKGSKNRGKARKRLIKLRVRIDNVRNDNLHRLTTDLTRRFQTIGIEAPELRGDLRNRPLARYVAAGFFEFQWQLEYKAAMRGGQVVVAESFFPAARRCSHCGHTREELPSSAREWTCPKCGTRHDRGLNAAINLRNYAAVSSTVSACGEEGSGSGRKTGTKPASMKQEPNGKPDDV